MAIDVAGWLGQLGLGQYATGFRDNDVDGELLRHLTAEDLIGLGVTSIGHRRKLLLAIAALGADAAPASAPAPAPSVPPGQPGAERRQLTVMFCDLVGSTALSTAMDPEDLREVIASFQARCSEVIRRYDGFVAKFMGDGILVYFGYPHAHEDAAERSARAGLDIVAAVADLGAGVRQGRGLDLAVRIGIATGVVVVGDLIGSGDAQERGVVGETPNLAARLQALAEPGTVLLDEPTRRLVGSLFEWRDLGTPVLKGFAEPVRVWQAVRLGPAESRFEALRAASLSPLIGRAEEIELMWRRWQRARQGEGQVVLLSGEPGIGKSHLAASLQERLADDPHTRLRYFCSPHHRDSPLQPFIAQLERAAGLAREDTVAVKLDKLDALLAPSPDSSADSPADAGAIADLLGVPGEGRYPALPQDPLRKREQTLAALVRQLEALARQRPVLALFEDAHWADSTSLELLDRLVARLARLPILLVVSFRPEFQPPWLGPAHVSSVSLRRLGQRDTESIVASVTAGKRLPPEILARIVERTDGIPLFVEELTKSLVEGGLLREAGGAFVLDGPLPPMAIPTSLQASLLARLDRLASVREVAQIGAVIGREFGHELLAAVARRSDGELQDSLDRLVEAGLVFRHGTPPSATYLFKHALVQDAAYSTLLRSNRQELHARIGRALEEKFPDLADAQPEVLAHHFTEAGLGEPAIEQWRRAGAHAHRRSANVEAVAHLGNAIRLAQALPADRQDHERELALQLALGPPLMATRGFGAAEVERTYARARELCRHLGPGPTLFTALRGLWEYYEIRAHVDEAREIANEVFAIAEKSGDRTLMLVAHDVLGDSLLWVADFAASVEHTGRAIGLYDPERDRQLALAHGGYDPMVACRLFGAHALWYLGHADRALQQCHEALAFARALDHPPTSAFVAQAALHHYLRDEPAEAEIHADAALALARQHDFKFWLGHAAVSHGWAVACRGEAEGIDEMRRGIEAYRATGAELEASLWLAMLADGLLRHDRADEALPVAADAIAAVAATGVRLHLAELHRLQGLALARTGARDKAEAALRRAVAIAQAQGAKPLEQRAARTLAELPT